MIERATMDGNLRTVLHRTGLSTVYGLTIDYATQTLYWVDYSYNRIEKSSVNGSNRQQIRTGLRDPFAVTYYSGKLYWTDWSVHHIYSMSTASSSATIYSVRFIGRDANSIRVISHASQPNGTISNYNYKNMVNLSTFCIILDMYSY